MGLPRPNPFRHPCKLALISPLFNQDIILTFCAIGWSTFGDFEWVQMDTYRRIVEINIFGLLQALKKAAPLVRKGKGRIVTVTSGLARSPAASRSSYIITKYGGMGLMECVRYELKRFGVKVLAKETKETSNLKVSFLIVLVRKINPVSNHKSG